MPAFLRDIKPLLSAAARTVLSVGVMVTALFVAAPLYVVMPSAGLDPSWEFAVNQAAADRLAFGREIIFTFGPYAEIYTRLFHPGVDGLVLGAGLFFAVCFGALAVVLAKRSFWWGLLLLYLIAGQMYSGDVVLAAYGLLLVVAIGNRVSELAKERRRCPPVEQALFAILLLPLGLLPLIKGSTIVNVVVCSVAAAWLFYSARCLFLAVASLVVPPLGVIVFWLMAGQSTADLPLYFTNMLHSTAGYSEAMALPGPARDVVLFLLAAAVVLYVIVTGPAKPVVKAPLLLAFGVFLFSGFKAGFVRHDGHALVAAGIIILAPALIALSAWRTRTNLAGLGFAVIAWFTIDYGYIQSAYEILYLDPYWTYERGVEGVRQRLSNAVDLNQRFATAVLAIAGQARFPRLEGTTDIYNYGQAYLLASENAWQPRPVLQSYSAYTPRLAGLNRDFLAGDKAPDNLLFRRETIDNRFPSLDDGPSWPVMLARYIPSEKQSENDYLVLTRDPAAGPPEMRDLEVRTARLGELVDIPPQQLLYAEIDLRPSLIGKLASLVYKTAPLQIRVSLVDGSTRDFRLISGMARAGFLLSPLIDNTGEFAYLFSDPGALAENAVRSIRIEGNPLFWQQDYTAKLRIVEPVVRHHEPDALKIAGDVTEGPPNGLSPSKVESCEAVIDHLNGSPATPEGRMKKLVSLSGWMTLSGKNGTTPDNVYVVLSANGHSFYVKTRRAARSDVKNHFRQPAMREPGFTVTFNTSALPDDVMLQLARETAGRLELCGNLRIALSRRGTEPSGAVGVQDPSDRADMASSEERVAECEGNIDALNGEKPEPVRNAVSGVIEVRGWTTIAGRAGIVPDAIFIRLTPAAGRPTYIKARSTPREDVNDFFGQPNLPDSGFLATIDAAKLKGDYTISVARLYQGQLQRCEKLSFPISVRHSSTD